MTAVLRAWAPALVCAAVIFAASSRPTIPVDLDHGLDKVAHFAVYTVLGIALARGQHLTGWSWVVALVLGLAYAASDEFHQSFVPGRSSEFADWVADALGVATGIFSYHQWRLRRPGRARRGAATAASPSP